MSGPGRAVELALALLDGVDPGHALDVASRALTDAGASVDRRSVAGVPALVAHRGTRSDAPGLVLSGHLDVVPVGEGWTQAPFGVEGPDGDGRIHGRGASDMRGPVACALAAIEASDAPATVVLTTDEETSMATARTFAVEPVVDGAALVVVCEPTGLDVAWCGKGVAWFELDVATGQGHASTPRGPGEGRRGPSAAERLVELLAELPPDPLGVEAHEALGPATAALTGLSTPDGPFNVLPGQALARLDCRFPHPGTPEAVERAVAGALGVPCDGVTLSLVKEEPAFQGDPSVAARVADILAGPLGRRPEVGGVMYASEAGHWGPRAPTVVCGPGSIGRAHAPDEFITVDELAQGVAAYAALLEAYGSKA